MYLIVSSAARAKLPGAEAPFSRFQSTERRKVPAGRLPLLPSLGTAFFVGASHSPSVGEENIHICSPERLKSSPSCPSCPIPIPATRATRATFWSVRLRKTEISATRAPRGSGHKDAIGALRRLKHDGASVTWDGHESRVSFDAPSGGDQASLECYRKAAVEEYSSYR